MIAPVHEQVEGAFIERYLDNGGGGECDGSSPTFISCKFDNNQANGSGGAISAGGA